MDFPIGLLSESWRYSSSEALPRVFQLFDHFLLCVQTNEQIVYAVAHGPRFVVVRQNLQFVARTFHRRTLLRGQVRSVQGLLHVMQILFASLIGLRLSRPFCAHVEQFQLDLADDVAMVLELETSDGSPQQRNLTMKLLDGCTQIGKLASVVDCCVLLTTDRSAIGKQRQQEDGSVSRYRFHSSLQMQADGPDDGSEFTRDRRARETTNQQLSLPSV
jgi:hypothetical protein